MSEWATETLEGIAAPIERPFAMGPFGSRIKKENYRDSGVPVIRGGNLQGIRFNDEGYVFLEEEKAEELSASMAEPGDVVFVAQGGIGQVGLVPNDGHYDRFILSQNLMKVTVDPAKADPAYVFYYFRSRLGQHEILSYGNPTGVPCISRPLTSLKSFSLPLPPLDAQRGIAHILGTLDDKIELNRRMNRTLEAIARAIFKSWFVNFDPVHAKAEGREPVGMDPETAALFSDSFQDSPLGKIPKGWDIGGMSDFAKVRYGPAYASKLFNDKGDGLPLLRIRDLRTHAPQVFTTEEHPRGDVVSLGDIVIGMDGEFRAHLWTGPDSWMNQRVCKLAPLQQELRSFLYFAAKRPLAECERSKTGTTVIHLGKGDIDSFRLIRPPHAILEAYSRLSDPILSLGTRLAGSSSVLASLRDVMLPRLLSGSLTVEATGET